jgi:hypothetical protein
MRDALRPVLKKDDCVMRILRPAQYVAYVIGLSFVLSLPALVFWTSEVREASRLSFLGGSMAMMVPFVVCQIVFAGLAVKVLSLQRLFVLSVAVEIGCYLLGLLFNLAPRQVGQWLTSLGFVSGGPLLWLMVPVAILFLAQRRREKRSRSERQAGSGDGASQPEVSASSAHTGIGRNASIRPWYYWDMGLIAIPLSFAILIDPFGVFNYIDGLINDPLLASAFFGFVFLVPPALICLAIVLWRMLVVWPTRIHGWLRLVLCWLAVVAVFAVCFLLPFTGLMPKPWETYTWGFRRNMQARADIGAIQTWLATLDPNDCQHQMLGLKVAEGVNIPNPPKYVAPPDSISCLRPRHTDLSLDDAGRPLIRLMWGSG